MIPSKKILHKKIKACRQENLINIELFETLLHDDSPFIIDLTDLSD
jgi:hypothetical protein